MNAQHTPGPWQASAGKGSFSHQILVDNRAIAMVWWHHPGQRPKEAAANQEAADARLIAAAPALSDSLRELSAWMREHTGPADDGTLDLLMRAHSALVSAHGPDDPWGDAKVQP